MSAGCAHALETGIAGDPSSPVHRLDPRAKLLGFGGVTLVAVSSPLGAWPVHVTSLGVLAGLGAAARVPWRTVWARVRIVLPLVVLAAAFVPFVRSGGTRYDLGPVAVSETGLAILAGVTVKACVGVLSAVLLGATTTFPDIVHALERLRAPRLLTQIAALMYRYLFLIVEECRRIRAAAAARGYRPRHALGTSVTGRMLTALFLRSYDRAERVHAAMLARGYRGQLPQLRALTFRAADAAFLLGLTALILPVRLLELA